jgi:hypothetical protein
VGANPQGDSRLEGFGETIRFTQSPQIMFHLNPLLWWSVFNLHNEEVLWAISWDYPTQNRLGERTIGDFFRDLELDPENQSPPSTRSNYGLAQGLVVLQEVGGTYRLWQFEWDVVRRHRGSMGGGWLCLPGRGGSSRALRGPRRRPRPSRSPVLQETQPTKTIRRVDTKQGRKRR